jgi:spermidine/putrescine transport system permease protein
MSPRLRAVCGSTAMIVICVLYLPMFAVAAFSLNASRIGFVWKGFTLNWYWGLLHNNDVLQAALNTLILAVASTAVSTVLGTFLALGMQRFPWGRRTRAFLDLALYLPVITPDIVFAVAVLVAFRIITLDFRLFELGLPTMIVAHVTFQIAFVAMVVSSRLATIGHILEEAAKDLYANSWQTLRRVTLPLLMPGIVAGAMLAFTLSLDDFVISFFTKGGPASTTLPLYIYASLRRGISPEIYALSTLIFLFTIILVVGLERATRLAKE